MKKQCNTFTLTSDCKNYIREMAEERGLSMSACVETLVREAYRASKGNVVNKKLNIVDPATKATDGIQNITAGPASSETFGSMYVKESEDRLILE